MAIGFVLFSVANSKAPDDVKLSFGLDGEALALQWIGGPRLNQSAQRCAQGRASPSPARGRII
jgi:hypothetical protein